MPVDAPEDILPGVLLHYDVPDLVRTLGSRATVTIPTVSSNFLFCGGSGVFTGDFAISTV